MILAYPQYFTDRSRFLTYTVVAGAFTQAGHTLTEDIQQCDAVLFSMCDVMEYPQLVRLRAATDKPILVGGSFAFNFWSAKLYADAVWVGEVYDLSACRSWDEICAHPACYTGGDRLPVSSTRICWEQVPVAQTAPRRCYYWGGQGCKNKCRFCFTSWTHPHQVNTPERIASAKEVAARHKLHLMICSNEYSDGQGGRTQDMLLRDYLRVPVRQGMVRMGIEFATEESRRWMGKSISDRDIIQMVFKMAREGIGVRLFHIAGYDSREDWLRYMALLCGVLDQARPARLMHLMFNNLQYQNYTPLYALRRSIDPDRYLSVEDTRQFYDLLRSHTPHILVGAPSRFQHVAARMGVELARDREQTAFWLRHLRGTSKLTVDEAFRAMEDTKIFDTPQLRLDMRSGAISIVPEN